MITDYEGAVRNIRKELKRYVGEHKVQSLVMGVSGGVDSAVIAALARPVCDELKIPLIGRSISIVSNTPDEVRRAFRVGQLFCNNFKHIDLAPLYNQTVSGIMEDAASQDTNNESLRIRLGNIKARMRMMYLYDLASQHKGLVLSSENYTEHMLGFWTLHGDVGDFGMIRNLWKTEIYQMATYLALNVGSNVLTNSILDCASAEATDGLGVSNTSLEQIGAESYDEVDTLLMDVINKTVEEKDKKHPVILRYRKNHYKHKNPFNIQRSRITSDPLTYDRKDMRS